MRITRLAMALVLGVGLGLVACAEQPGEEAAQTMEMAAAVDLEAVGEAFAAVRAEYKRAFDAGDVAALAALHTADATRLPPLGEVVKGRPAIEQEFAAVFAATTSREITITGTDMGASGSLAYEIGTYSTAVQVEGASEPVVDEGDYLVVAKQIEDGSWKIVAHMWTSSLPETQAMQ